MLNTNKQNTRCKMKSLLFTWAVTFVLYSLTSVVRADGQLPADHMHIWTGFSEGSVCIHIQDSADSSNASAELWLVSFDQVEWIKDVEGYSCINVDIDSEAELHAITYDPGIEITVVRDDTSKTVLTRL